MSCPFPDPIKELHSETLTVSDQKKAEQKMPNSIRLSFNNFNTFNRSFCTSPYFIPIRSLTSQNKNSTNKKDHKNFKNREHCENDAPKIECDPTAKRCPRFVLADCPQSKGSDCLRRYHDVSIF